MKCLLRKCATYWIDIMVYNEDMKIFIGADHRGFKLKEHLRKWLVTEGHEVIDCGNEVYDESDDYVDFAVEVGRRVATGDTDTQILGVAGGSPEDADIQSLGIVICGSGIGVSIAANRLRSVRCALVHSPEEATHGRERDHANVIALGADNLESVEAEKIVLTFLKSKPKTEERYIRRSRKLDQI